MTLTDLVGQASHLEDDMASGACNWRMRSTVDVVRVNLGVGSARWMPEVEVRLVATERPGEGQKVGVKVVAVLGHVIGSVGGFGGGD